ncbi:spermidine synthase [Shewanella sp. NIFS-20-20]|uniref:spermidine synthase n=1 Tax=Shewanella sp. NIFS-20-20 TaxID=2853806 RepID=UPI001C482975|nr:fused MFS/spermidine synthase [Shewanella sp. NIFS-20-20]MBV7314165.1 fused MFS/spermidine synthase [Shewanella sp. NIFS-20-20]
MSEYQCLWQGEDQYGPISVVEDNDYRLLAFGDNDEQSKQLKVAPHIPQHTYIQAMLLSLLFIKPKSAIVLGLGGGALLHSLKHYDPAMKLTAVELRPQVIELAKRYFRVQPSKKLQLIEADAMAFLAEANHKRCDVIYADIYTDAGIDKQQLSQQFIDHAINLLKADGILVLNCWKEHSRDVELLARLQASFVEVYACLTSGSNWVIFAAKQAGTLRDHDLKSAIDDLSCRLDYSVSRSLSRFGPWL